MRAGSSLTTNSTTEGRFDESSQKDVLSLAARLQREHFETMSASEIEQAAAEAGLGPEFVREAIRRISEAPRVEPEEEQRPATKEEWAVGIGVPVFVISVFLIKHIASNPGWSVGRGVLELLLLVVGVVLVILAALGVKSLLGTRMDRSVAGVSAPKTAAPVRNLLTPASFTVYGLTGLTLLTLLMRSSYNRYGILPDSIFFLAGLAPFFGGIQRTTKEAFWRGGLVGVIAYSAMWIEAQFRNELNVGFGHLPFMMAFGLVAFGLLSLAGFGIRSIFYKQPKVDHDRAEMLKQLFELQAALDAHRENRTFLSVDVVGSTAMKTGASELEVEFSFLQYQTWVAETVRLYGGDVQSVAGDGAMAVFRDPGSAVGAARALQVGIGEFNEKRNRLAFPFAIRCGLAEGRVGMDTRSPLGMVQSPVVDRAAALQKSASPGAIVVTPELVGVAMPVLESLHRTALYDGATAYSWP